MRWVGGTTRKLTAKDGGHATPDALRSLEQLVAGQIQARPLDRYINHTGPMKSHRHLLPLVGLALVAACTQNDATGPSPIPGSMTITFDTLDFGATAIPGIVVRDQSGTPISIGTIASQITLASSDTTVAQVDAGALTLTGTGIGDAVITAHYGDITATGTLAVRVGPAPAQKLVTGDLHSCAINALGETHCWGTNANGTLGDGLDLTGASGSPLLVAGEHSFTTLTAGYHTCALEDGAAWCWGEGDEGALGNGADTNAIAPVRVNGGLTFAQISAGWGHVCGLTTEGAAYCWGFNKDGQVGNGSPSGMQTEPVAVDTDIEFAQIQASGDHSCALTRLGKVYCWGDGTDGILGTGDEDDQPSPVAVLDTLTFVSLSGGFSTQCGIDRTGLAICWGRNDAGQAGNGSFITPQLSPTPAASSARFSMIGVGAENHLCAVERVTNQLYCWGSNPHGQLGSGDRDDRASPTAVADFFARAVATGEGHSCAMDTNGDVYCWGSNQEGQVGNGSIDDSGDNDAMAPSKVVDIGGISPNRAARSVPRIGSKSRVRSQPRSSLR